MPMEHFVGYVTFDVLVRLEEGTTVKEAKEAIKKLQLEGNKTLGFDALVDARNAKVSGVKRVRGRR